MFMKDIEVIASDLSKVTSAETNKPYKLEAISALDQIIRAIETDMVSVVIDRKIDQIINWKQIILSGRVGAMMLTANLNVR